MNFASAGCFDWTHPVNHPDAEWNELERYPTLVSACGRRSDIIC